MWQRMPMNLEDLFSVTGKVAVVTGGSRGIGFMIARGFVENGVRVYITARKAEQCDAAAADLNKVGECVSMPADISTAEQAKAFAAQVAEREPKVHILVNNAGATWGAPIGEFPEAGFDKVMAINVKAPYMLTEALLPRLRAAATAEDPARVIMIGSVDGIRVPSTENYPYAASKAGIHMLGRHLAHRLVGDNITVNSIAPGPFHSKMMEFVIGTPEGEAMVASSVPRKRVGTPEDVAGTAIYLASRAGAYITGVTIPVDGGISTHG
jgi:NAD(P)-dependent dehydrogenase (short-subunit alcohol dehydrogenase family)